MYERMVLGNGLRVLVAPMPHTRSVSIGFFVAAGSRYEADEIAGASHFVEHMLFKGTRRRPTARELAEAIEGIGGLNNAGTGREMTDYWVKVASEHFWLALDVMADMLRNSLFDPTEIERERQVILEEIKMSSDTPDELATLALAELQWEGNPAGRDIAGTRDSVRCISREQLLSHMARLYGPHNTVLSIAGNVALQGIIDSIHDWLDDWAGGSRLRFQAVQPNGRNGPRSRVIYRPTEQTNLCLSVPALARNDPRRFSLRMMNAVLGEGMASRLFQQIREKRGLAYSVGSYIETLEETGVVGVYAGVDPGQADCTLEAILDEWERFREERISQEELNRAREYHKGRMQLSLEDTMTVASWNGRQELQQGEIMEADEYLAAMDAVTVADVQEMARLVLDPRKISLAVVGPHGTEAEPDEDSFQRVLNA